MRIIKYIAILLFAVFSFVACSQIFPDATHLTIRECSQHPAVEIQLIRSATLKINYAGKIILIDPMLSPKGCFESFAGKEKNPIVELPLSISEILDGVDIVLLTHNHPDHWDKVAGESIPKQIPVITQKVDREAIQEYGFLNVIDVDVSTTWDGIEIQRTNGKHGTDDILEAEPLLGTVSGYILKADGYPTVYILGDTILNDEVRNTVKSSGADIFVLNSGGAKLPVPGFENHLILMDTKQAIEVVNMVPKAKFVAVHMEALDHCTVSRAELRKVAVENGIDRDRLIIPNDGEVIRFWHCFSVVLPEEMRNDMFLLTGCMADASSLLDIETYLADAGFEDIHISPRDESREFICEWVPGRNIADYVVSATIEAAKPKE